MSKAENPAFPNLKGFKVWALFLMIAISTTMLPLNDLAMFTMMNTIRSDLHMSLGTMQWLVTCYLTVAACCIVPAGRYSDFYGRFNVFIIGLIFFTAGLILLSIGSNIWLVIIGRGLAGVASGIYLTVGGAILNVAIPEKYRPYALMVWMGCIMLGVSAGLFFGGLIADFANWRLLFWVSLGVTVCAFFVALWLRGYEVVSRNKISIDYLGVLLLSIFLVLFVLIFSKSSEWGWTSPVSITFYAVCPAALVLFLFWQARAKEPLVSFKACKNITFLVALIMIAGSQYAWFSMIYVYALYASSAFGLGYSVFATGASLLPFAICPFILSLLSGKIIGKLGMLPTLLISTALLFAGILLLSFVDANTSYANIWWRLTLCGIGLTFPWIALLPLALSEMPMKLSGLATGTFEVIRFSFSVFSVGIVSSVYLTSIYNKLTTLASAKVSAQQLVYLGHSVHVNVAQRLQELGLSHLKNKLQTIFTNGFQHAVLIADIGAACALGVIILFCCYRFFQKPAAAAEG